MDVPASSVASLKDIGKLKDKEVAGVIVGKAIYTGDVDCRAPSSLNSDENMQ